MSDLHARFGKLDAIPAPDLWPAIESSVSREASTPATAKRRSAALLGRDQDRWPWRASGRLVLALLLSLLLLAGAAAAAYLAAQTWLSSTPRGIQYSDEFRLTEVFRDGGGPVEAGPRPIAPSYGSFAMAPDGSAIYAVRRPQYPEPPAVLSRISGPEGAGLESERLVAEDVIDYADFVAVDAWPELEPSSFTTGAPLTDGLAIGPDGAVYVAVAAHGLERAPVPGAGALADELRGLGTGEEQVAQTTTAQPFLTAVVLVLRGDADPETVVTQAELEGAGALDPDRLLAASMDLAASAPGRLWLMAESQGPAGTSQASLVQVVDADGDGDWADRRILPVTLPPTIPSGATATSGWMYLAPVAEPSGPSVDRTDSVLLPMLSTAGEYRIYRVRDEELDGDVGGPGETEHMFTGFPGFGDHPWPSLAPRVVVDAGHEVLRELVVGSLTRPTRISRVLADGETRDIVRAVDFGPWAVLPAPHGDIFVVTQEKGGEATGPAFVIHRLAPVPIGEASPGTSPGGTALGGPKEVR